MSPYTNSTEHQVGAGLRCGTRHDQAGDPEQQVHDVVQDRDLEQPEQPGVGMVAGERQIAEVGGDTGNEAQHTDEQEDDADDGGGLLHVCAGATGCGGAVGHDGKTPWDVVLGTIS
jgi:hypothetical protein